MAHVEKRTHRLKSSDGKVRTTVTYRARYRVDGQERSKSFDRKLDADRWLAEQVHRVNTGTWVDPSEGRRTFREVALRWQAGLVHRPSTQAQVASHLERHILPAFGDKQVAAIRKSDVQAWVKGRAELLGPATVETMFRHLSSIFRSAVEDRLIGVSPCTGVRLPRRPGELVVPMSVAEVTRLAEAIDDRYRGLVLLAAGTGLRQGEAFGLTLDRVDFLRRQLRVDRGGARRARAGIRADEDGGLGPHGADGGRDSARAGPAPRAVPGRGRRRPDLHRGRRRPAAPEPLRRGLVEGALGRRPPGRSDLPRPPPPLRLAAHPPRRVGEGGPGPPRSRLGVGDAGHLLAPLARLRRSHARRGVGRLGPR